MDHMLTDAKAAVLLTHKQSSPVYIPSVMSMVWNMPLAS